MAKNNQYKLIIIGAGPGGMTASIYASRYKIPHLIISPKIGGAAAEAHLVENWPGEKQIKGTDLMNKIWEHAKSYNPDYWPEEAKRLEKITNGFRVTTNGAGKAAESATIIFAGGTQFKKLSIPGEKELLGRGVSYCATCDGGFFKEKVVAVIGGANSAVMAAAELAQLASQVYLIYRSELKAEPVWIYRLKENKKIIFVTETNIKKIVGKNKVEKVELDKPYQGKTELSLDGVFIEIGVAPLVELVKSVNVELDGGGAIKINEKRETNVKGIFAAGDATNGSGGFRQMITAASEGAIAARGVFEYLKEHDLI